MGATSDTKGSVLTQIDLFGGSLGVQVDPTLPVIGATWGQHNNTTTNNNSTSNRTNRTNRTNRNNNDDNDNDNDNNNNSNNNLIT